MSAPPDPPRPRLLRSDESPAPSPATPPAKAGGRRRWLLPLAIAAALLAAGGWGLEARRSSALEARVTELSAALGDARAEIAARRDQLQALRGAAADLEAQAAALRTLAERDPTAPVLAPAPPAAGAGRP